MKTLLLLAGSSAALALAAAETGSGTGSGQPDDLLKSDAAPAPKTADEVAPAAPQPDPSVGAVGNADTGETSPPTTSGEAETTTAGAAAAAGDKKADGDKADGKKSKAPAKAAAEKGDKKDPQAGVKRAYMVWAQPGHETLGVGQMIAVPTAEADVLRGAGRARFAAEAEVNAAKESDNPRAILVLDGV